MTYIPEALRRLVAQRAGGRCEYCRLHEDDAFFAHEVDHIYAEKYVRRLYFDQPYFIDIPDNSLCSSNTIPLCSAANNGLVSRKR